MWVKKPVTISLFFGTLGTRMEQQRSTSRESNRVVDYPPHFYRTAINSGLRHAAVALVTSVVVGVCAARPQYSQDALK